MVTTNRTACTITDSKGLILSKKKKYEIRIPVISGRTVKNAGYFLKSGNSK
jgi:hypothetical protein